MFQGIFHHALIPRLIVIGAGVVYIGYRVVTDGIEEKAAEAEREGYRRRIAIDPTNLAAYEALGDSYRRAKKFDEAKRMYLRALDLATEDSKPETVKFKLRHLDEEIRFRSQKNLLSRLGIHTPKFRRPWLLCKACATPNPPSAKVCKECGSALPHDSYWDALTDKSTIRAALEFLGMLIILAVVFQIFNHLPFKAKASVVVATAIVLAWRWYLVYEERWWKF